MPFILPDLPYDYDALAPVISAETMHVHHDKHHAQYVAKLNDAIAQYPMLQDKTIDGLLDNLDSLPGNIQVAVRNNGGGHWNHSMFWKWMTPEGIAEPQDEVLVEQIEGAFGSIEGLRQRFLSAATNRFGSGWVWLVAETGSLRIETTANQDSPLMIGQDAILGLDVWEHSYYLDYLNRRPDYVAAWWNIINWQQVALMLREHDKNWSSQIAIG